MWWSDNIFQWLFIIVFALSRTCRKLNRLSEWWQFNAYYSYHWRCHSRGGVRRVVLLYFSNMREYNIVADRSQGFRLSWGRRTCKHPLPCLHITERWRVTQLDMPQLRGTCSKKLLYNTSILRLGKGWLWNVDGGRNIVWLTTQLLMDLMTDAEFKWL